MCDAGYVVYTSPPIGTTLAPPTNQYLIHTTLAEHAEAKAVLSRRQHLETCRNIQ